MLKRRILVGFLVLLMLALPVAAAAASHVDFKDDNLKAAVVEEYENLGKVYLESKIPQADMKLLSKIFAWGPYVSGEIVGTVEYPGLDSADPAELIRNLSGLEYALKLEALDISNNFIKDLAPISALPLTYLNVKNNDDGTWEGYGSSWERVRVRRGRGWRWVWRQVETDNVYTPGSPAFSYNPSSTQMKLLQEIQHQGAVVDHDGLVSRISGADRFQTAVRIWQNMYTEGFTYNETKNQWVMDYNPNNTIVLTRGDDFADALVAAPLAFALGSGDEDNFVPAPILLTTSDKLQKDTKDALISYIKKFEKELTGSAFGGVFDVYVLGGTAAVSEKVVNELIWAIESEYEALDVRAVRVGGADRYETSVNIAKKVDDLLGNGVDFGEIIFASGENFPDALSAAPYAAGVDNRDMEELFKPILLTKGDSLPAVVSDYLKDIAKKTGADDAIVGPFDAVVAGGTAAVSENVLSALNKLKYREAGKDINVFSDVTRVWGADRYETAVELGKYYGLIDAGANGKITRNEADGWFYVATGENFADALTGAVLAASYNTGILLVKQDTIPGSVEKVMNFQSNRDAEDFTSYLTVLGGENAVSMYNAVKMYNLVRYPAWAPR